MINSKFCWIAKRVPLESKVTKISTGLIGEKLSLHCIPMISTVFQYLTHHRDSRNIERMT